MKKKIELPNIPMLKKPVIAINIDFKKKKEHLIIGDFDNINSFLRGQKDVEIIFEKIRPIGSFLFDVITDADYFSDLMAYFIDTSKSKNNIHLIAPQMRYKAEVDKRIKESGCRIRRDSTRFVDTLITASPEFFWNMTNDKMVEYFQRAVDFMKLKIRPDMIFSAVIHLDEKTPHLHLCFVPLTKDNRLTAKEILGNRAKLSKWQDEFHEYMVKFYPDIERGTSATLTQRKHIPSYIFKSAAKLGKMQTEIEEVLKNTNLINASKSTQKAIKLIETWIPMVETFETKVNMLTKSLQAEQKNNKALTDAFVEARDKADSRLMELVMLRKQVETLQKLYKKVPEEIRQKIETKKRNKEVER